LTRWSILTGEYPPQPGGVSDYTRLVAQGLAALGDEMAMYAPPQGIDPLGVRVRRLPYRFGLRGLRWLALTSGLYPSRSGQRQPGPWSSRARTPRHSLRRRCGSLPSRWKVDLRWVPAERNCIVASSPLRGPSHGSTNQAPLPTARFIADPLMANMKWLNMTSCL
jgi:hypothetical protein